MAQPKQGIAPDGRIMHYSVGALIKRGPSYLLFDRVNAPLGYAGPAGHIDEGEDDPALAVAREVLEETGLIVTKSKLLYEEVLPFDTCGRGIEVHHWWFFECEVSGAIRPQPTESRNIGWYTPGVNWPEQIAPPWAYWFRKLGIQ